MCKVEEIHTTLRKHLAKEEEQLFPLLLQHFTHAEQVSVCWLHAFVWCVQGLTVAAVQAELVAQFLCCIPLTTVDAVLGWLKPSVPAQEQEELLQQVQDLQPPSEQFPREPLSSELLLCECRCGGWCQTTCSCSCWSPGCRQRPGRPRQRAAGLSWAHRAAAAQRGPAHSPPVRPASSPHCRCTKGDHKTAHPSAALTAARERQHTASSKPAVTWLTAQASILPSSTIAA